MSSYFRLYPGDCCRDSGFYSISLNNVASFVVAGNEFGVTQTANFVSPGVGGSPSFSSVLFFYL